MGKNTDTQIDTHEDDNQRCMECIAAFEKDVGFDPKMCRFCNYGAEKHRKEVRNGDPWGNVDWNSSKYKEFYQG